MDAMYGDTLQDLAAWHETTLGILHTMTVATWEFIAWMNKDLCAWWEVTISMCGYFTCGQALS